MRNTILAQVAWWLLIATLAVAALYFGLARGDYAQGAYYFVAALFADRTIR